MKKPDTLFGDMETVDIIRLVVDMAVSGKESGAPITVKNARFRGQKGIWIWIPNYWDNDGIIVEDVVQSTPQP